MVNFVRYQVSEGKELTEIGEMICDHCLAPDTNSWVGMGCDNMTLLVVAITHGRSKEEWYAWIADRVKNSYGYETPSTPPQLYGQSRLMAFRANKEIYDKHNRSPEEKYASAQSVPSPTRPRPLSTNDSSAGSASKDEPPESKSKLGSNGPISHQAGGDIVDHSGRLLFVNDETEFDNDDDFEEDNGGRSFFTETLKASSQIQPAAPSISSSDPVIVPPDEHSESLTCHYVDTEGEVSSSFLIHCISSHPSFHSEQKQQPQLPNGDAMSSPESKTPSPLFIMTAKASEILTYSVHTILGIFKRLPWLS